MVENVELNRVSSPDDWEELFRCYRELETELCKQNFDRESVAFLIDRLDKLFDCLKISNPAEIDFQPKLGEACQRLNELIPRLRQEKENVLRQITAIKTGRAVMSAYQKPRLGMGYTEGKFLDNRK
jgi:hypothetical protein